MVKGFFSKEEAGNLKKTLLLIAVLAIAWIAVTAAIMLVNGFVK
ncbi:MAG: hypothetical protein Q7R70_00650 [Candidatus Diapherotrites archaeon]|nr:hypothetical protein [Candidatus Diapherotrites archaeon]